MGAWKHSVVLAAGQWGAAVAVYMVGFIPLFSLPLAWTALIGFFGGAVAWGRWGPRIPGLAVRSLIPHFLGLFWGIASTAGGGVVQSSYSKSLLWTAFVLPNALALVWLVTWTGLGLGERWKAWDENY